MTTAAPELPRSDLLAYALFDLDPRVRSLRHPLLTFLVSVALFELDRPAYREEIFAACEELFLSNDAVSLDQVEHAVKTAKGAGLLEDAGQGRVALSPQRRDQLSGAAERIAAQRETFHREIADSVEAQLGEALTEGERGRLKDCLESFVQRLFQEHSVALARAFGPDGKGFDSTTASHLSSKSLESLARSISGVEHGSKLRLAQIASGIREGLLDLGTDAQRYLAAVYHKTIAFALLRQDPSVRKVKRSLAKRRVFYLDTNVAMSLLFSADPRHEHVRAAVDGALEVGCDVVVSPFTLEELRVQLEESNKRYERLQSHAGLLSIIDDVVLRTFAARREKSPGLRWAAFLAGCFPPDEALEDLGVETAEEDAPAARVDARREQVMEAVRSIKGRDTHPKVVERDTDNLLLVQARRKKLRADEMGRRVWLITLDQSLKLAEHHLIANDLFEVQSSKQVNDWAAELSFHLPPDDVDLGEYVLHMVQSQLRLLAEDPIFADVNFLSVLEESPFEIDELLKAKPAQLRRVLVALQKEREIQGLLEDEPNEPAERDAWAGQLASIVWEKLDESEEFETTLSQLEAERDEALAESESTRRGLDEWIERLEELERRIDENAGEKDSPRRQASILRRLFGGR